MLELDDILSFIRAVDDKSAALMFIEYHITSLIIYRGNQATSGSFPNDPIYGGDVGESRIQIYFYECQIGRIVE